MQSTQYPGQSTDCQHVTPIVSKAVMEAQVILALAGVMRDLSRLLPDGSPVRVDLVRWATQLSLWSDDRSPQNAQMLRIVDTDQEA